MKKILLIFFLAALGASVSGQEQKFQTPKVMVIPEEAFCINNGMYKVNAAGEKIADYVAAMRNDNILDAINSFENLMAGYNFQLTNLQQCLDELKEEGALDNVLKSKDDGTIIEDDLDKLSRIAGADILVKVAPKISAYGPDKRLELRVSSIDCASKKALLAFGPITKTSAGSTSMLLKAAVTDNIEQFALGLSKYFDSLIQKGREGSIIIKITDTCPLNFESTVTFRGEQGELSDLILMWVGEHTVDGTYTGGKTSRVSMKLDQVRIPLFGKAAFGKMKALNMEDFVKTGLVKLLENYGISVSAHAVGIGKVYLTLGKI
jgi:hypothetical protein